MQEEELSRSVIGCAYAVYNTLGAGFLENVYEQALLIELQHKNIACNSQVKLEVTYRNQIVGHYFADVVVENKIILELKASDSLAKSHEVQLVNYLAATGYDLGLLINFGPSEVTVRRKLRNLANLSR